MVTGIFGDKGHESPRELAEMIIKAFPDIANGGKGEDPEYAAWYENMLQLTAPDGVIYASADYPVPEDSIPYFYFYSVQRDRIAKVPLPPPGHDPSEA
ncbi:MAG: hypothetical protein Q9M24_02830 [Mariprofundaceae bacterium]|nr:hypothetical protein [Mariprofundaceae bacterium]